MCVTDFPASQILSCLLYSLHECTGMVVIHLFRQMSFLVRSKHTAEFQTCKTSKPALLQLASRRRRATAGISCNLSGEDVGIFRRDFFFFLEVKRRWCGKGGKGEMTCSEVRRLVVILAVTV